MTLNVPMKSENLHFSLLARYVLDHSSITSIWNFKWLIVLERRTINIFLTFYEKINKIISILSNSWSKRAYFREFFC